MHFNLETARTQLRPLSKDDTAFIFELLNSPGWIQFIGDRKVHTLSDAENYLDKILSNKSFFYSVIYAKQDQQPIGVITFLYRQKHDDPDLGFALLPFFMGKGYAYEAAASYLAALGMAVPGIKVTGITLPNNHSSIRLLVKLGMQFERNLMNGNELLHCYCMSLLDRQRPSTKEEI